MVYQPMSFSRGSKGIAGNGDASRVWKGEIAQMSIVLGTSFGRAHFLYPKTGELYGSDINK
jgi:hypothetical protein